MGFEVFEQILSGHVADGRPDFGTIPCRDERSDFFVGRVAIAGLAQRRGEVTELGTVTLTDDRFLVALPTGKHLVERSVLRMHLAIECSVVVPVVNQEGAALRRAPLEELVASDNGAPIARFIDSRNEKLNAGVEQDIGHGPGQKVRCQRSKVCS